MKGITIAEQCHVVNILPPVDINGGAVVSDYFEMALYQHASIIITIGAGGAASTVTLEESTTNAGAATTAIGFDYYAETTAAGDTLGARTTVANTGFATAVANNITYVIEVDASELTDGYPYLVLKMSNPGTATVASAVAILSGARYAQAVTPTAIA
jgi:hypothetical protein